MGEFLDDLNKAVESGEFNSDAAKKINEIDKLANSKTLAQSLEDLDKRLEANGVKDVSAEEVATLNSQYEKQMEKFKEDDMINAQTTTLIEIQNMVKLTISDMFDFIDGLETSKFGDKIKEAGNKYSNEFAKENEAYITLAKQLEEIKTEYASFYEKYLESL